MLHEESVCSVCSGVPELAPLLFFAISGSGVSLDFLITFSFAASMSCAACANELKFVRICDRESVHPSMVRLAKVFVAGFQGQSILAGSIQSQGFF